MFYPLKVILIPVLLGKWKPRDQGGYLIYVSCVFRSQCYVFSFPLALLKTETPAWNFIVLLKQLF